MWISELSKVSVQCTPSEIEPANARFCGFENDGHCSRCNSRCDRAVPSASGAVTASTSSPAEAERSSEAPWRTWGGVAWPGKAATSNAA